LGNELGMILLARIDEIKEGKIAKGMVREKKGHRDVKEQNRGRGKIGTKGKDTGKSKDNSKVIKK